LGSRVTYLDYLIDQEEDRINGDLNSALLQKKVKMVDGAIQELY